MVIWIYGQPCSGKTTLAIALKAHLEASFEKEGNVTAGQKEVIILDGDAFREIFGNTVYGREGRELNIKRAISVARYLEHAGHILICSFVTPYKSMRSDIEHTIKNVRFVYLEYTGERGRESYHAADFEKPEGSESYLYLNTSELNIEQCITNIKNYL